ncbi:MAG: hypothetical protein DCC67_12540 [Planctomycetota bacterium]|nr:MAG: hypothetical protein DCC67_12540 [Planctomycetota bacterium]
MNCPVCLDVTLLIADRQGIEVDYCPKCRGVWLDRGELDKILQREAAAEPPPSGRGADPMERRPRRDDDYDDDYRGDDRRRRKRSFWGELLDFD